MSSIYVGLRTMFGRGDKLEKIIGGFETTIGLLDDYVKDADLELQDIGKQQDELEQRGKDVADHKDRASRIAANLRNILD